tara:strand:- start:1838 stop:2104 length:267 start_codon:yes stop_codon:yes gene_type:complete
MKTFVVLIPVDSSIENPRNSCEFIEGTNFKIGGSVQATSIDVKAKILYELGDLKDDHNIEVEPITDFMDRFNDQDLIADDYFISYVYA